MDKLENKFGSRNIKSAEPLLPVYPVHSVEFPTLGDINIEGLGRLVEECEVPGIGTSLFQQIRFDLNPDNHVPVGQRINIEL